MVWPAGDPSETSRTHRAGLPSSRAPVHRFDEPNIQPPPDMTTPSVLRPLRLCAALSILAALPAAAQISQAESIPVVEKVGNRPQVSWTDGTDKGITYQANATDQAIKVWINIPAPGNYNIKVRHRRYGDRGQVQHLINSVPQGPERSFYKSVRR
jgi:hypothetical protein